MPRSTTFRTKVMMGYAAITVLLAGGMALTIRRLGSTATSQVAHVRAEEYAITIAERLRWRGELIVSDGRGYLISGDAHILTKLRETEASFDQDVRALGGEATSAKEASLFDDVERAAKNYGRVLDALIVEREQREGSAPLVPRFETDLLPLRRKFGESLDRLVDYKEGVIRSVYAQAERNQERLTSRMYGLLGILVFMGLGISSYFVKLLVRSFRQEHEALDIAQKALAARDELMGIVAHDLRNPLGAITMKASLLRKTGESEKARQQAESIEKIAERMEYLIRTMLDVTTLEAGHFSITPSACDVDDIVQATMEMFAGLAASKQIRLRRVVKESGLAIRADRERVLQVLSNLIGNAIKFTPEGGEVTISIERQGETVHFAVSDSGPGIAASHVARVFDRFWKHEASGKKGTGLGLFIAKGIVDAHGGRIGVESEPGHGATFYFVLPVAASLEAATMGSARHGPQPHA